MELGIKNKIAFVAASSQGLGKSVALELAKEGAKIIICGRNKQQLEKTKEEIEEGETLLRMIFLPTNMADKRNCTTLWASEPGL